MSYEFYKVFHILSILILFVSLAGYLYTLKRSFAIIHGLAMLFILVSGFGLMARLGLVTGIPTWVWIKITMWFCLGAVMAIIKRKWLPSNIQVAIWLALGYVAIFSAIIKPFLG